MKPVMIFIMFFIIGVCLFMLFDKKEKAERACCRLQERNRMFQTAISRKDETIRILRSEYKNDTRALKEELAKVHLQNDALKMAIEADRQKKDGA